MVGSWERVSEGKTLVGVDEDDTSFNVPNKTGGSKSINLAHSHTVNSHTHTTKDHALTIAEMPRHKHALDYQNVQRGTTGSPTSTRIPTSSNYTGTVDTNYTGSGEAHNHGETTASSPGTTSELSTSQSILNPYITVYIWKRIS